MDWKPIGEAPRSGRVFARDADGDQAWTWHDGSEWTRECWRETADRQEYLSEEWWSPVEYASDI